MAARSECEECTKKDQCEYRPASGTVLRCLDKQTTPAAPRADQYAGGAKA